MKKFTYSILLASLTVCFLSACSRATSLELSETEIVTSIEGGQGDIKVMTDGSPEITHVPNWMTATLVNDSTLHYTIRMNTDRALREDSIVLEASPLRKVIPVTQKYKATYIKFSPEKVEAPIIGGEVKVTVETDGNGALQVSDPGIARIEGNTLYVKTKFNCDTQIKKTILDVTCEDVTATLTVIQPANRCPNCAGRGHLNRPCSSCGGVGLHMCCNYTGKESCPKCHGTGWLVMRYNQDTQQLYE